MESANGMQHADGYVFISHATPDRAAAESLVTALEALSRPCWIATRDIPVGANFAEEIVRGVRGAAALVVFLSQKSVVSPHVRREVSMAIDMGKSLFPLSMTSEFRCAADLPGDWAYWLSLVQINSYAAAEHAAAMVQSQLSPGTPVQGRPLTVAAEAPGAQSVTGPGTSGCPPTVRRGAPSLDDRIRSALIEVAVSGLRFEIAVERVRRLGVSPDDVARTAYRLREAHLLTFDGDLNPGTVIQLER